MWLMTWQGPLSVRPNMTYPGRRFAKKDQEVLHPVGAKRYVDARGAVTEAIDRHTGVGRVRVETEQWRATTDLDGVIEVGTPVTVVDVRGARLVVEPTEI